MEVAIGPASSLSLECIGLGVTLFCQVMGIAIGLATSLSLGCIGLGVTLVVR